MVARHRVRWFPLPEDRTTISLSEEGDRIIKALVEAGLFRSEVAAFEAATSLAIAEGLTIDRRELGTTTTKWNVGTLDSRFRDLVVEFAPSGGDRPYETATLLAEAGLRSFDAALENEEEDLSTVLGIESRADGVA